MADFIKWLADGYIINLLIFGGGMYLGNRLNRSTIKMYEVTKLAYDMRIMYIRHELAKIEAEYLELKKKLGEESA